MTNWRSPYSQNTMVSFEYIDFGQKSCFLGPTIFKIPQPNWYFHTLDLYLSNLKGNNECALTCQATWSMHDNADARWKKTKKKLLWKKTAKLSFGYKRFTILVRSSSVVWVGTKVSSEKKTVENCTNVLQQPVYIGLKSILKDHSSNLTRDTQNFKKSSLWFWQISWFTLSKRQNHEEDFFKLCVLLRKSELYPSQKNMLPKVFSDLSPKEFQKVLIKTDEMVDVFLHLASCAQKKKIHFFQKNTLQKPGFLRVN